MAGLDKHIEKDAELGGYTFTCPGPGCGMGGTGFVSAGWPRKDQARERGLQHIGEHAGDGHVQPLHEFMEKHGLLEVDRTSDQWRELLAEGEND